MSPGAQAAAGHIRNPTPITSATGGISNSERVHRASMHNRTVDQRKLSPASCGVLSFCLNEPTIMGWIESGRYSLTVQVSICSGSHRLEGSLSSELCAIDSGFTLTG